MTQTQTTKTAERLIYAWCTKCIKEEGCSPTGTHCISDSCAAELVDTGILSPQAYRPLLKPLPRSFQDLQYLDADLAVSAVPKVLWEVVQRCTVTNEAEVVAVYDLP